MRMGGRASYDHASAVLEESTMLGAMSLMVDRLWVRSRMSTTLLQGDLAVDSELIQSMSSLIERTLTLTLALTLTIILTLTLTLTRSSLIEARREVIETYTVGGAQHAERTPAPTPTVTPTLARILFATQPCPGPALMRRDTDEDLFTMMAEVHLTGL